MVRNRRWRFPPLLVLLTFAPQLMGAAQPWHCAASAMAAAEGRAADGAMAMDHHAGAPGTLVDSHHDEDQSGPACCPESRVPSDGAHCTSMLHCYSGVPSPAAAEVPGLAIALVGATYGPSWSVQINLGAHPTPPPRA
ncbi:MAG: hypothetical protein R3E10_12415 [Gemmatimonadota bacterium]